MVDSARRGDHRELDGRDVLAGDRPGGAGRQPPAPPARVHIPAFTSGQNHRQGAVPLAALSRACQTGYVCNWPWLKKKPRAKRDLQVGVVMAVPVGGSASWWTVRPWSVRYWANRSVVSERLRLTPWQL